MGRVLGLECYDGRLQAFQEKQGRRDGGVALYVMEGLECAALAEDMVESFWVRIKGKANKADVFVEVYYRSPSQEDDTDELFYKELREISRSVALVLMGDFNFQMLNGTMI